MSSKREVELELQVWRERMNAIQNGVLAVQSQAQVFQIQANEARGEIARLEGVLAAVAQEESHATPNDPVQPEARVPAEPAAVPA